MEAPANATHSAPRPTNRSLSGLAIGALCGAIAWGIVQAVHPVFAVPERYHIAGIGAPVEQHEAFRHQQDIVDRRHLQVYLIGLAALTGAALGAWTGRSWLTTVLAAAQGMFGAYIAGALAAIFYLAMRNKTAQGDLLDPFLRQLLVGVPCGAGVGAGVVMLSGSWRTMGRGLVAGAIGGVIFSAIYMLSVALALPEANTESLLPEEALTRLIWFLTLGGSMGLTAGFAASGVRAQA